MSAAPMSADYPRARPGLGFVRQTMAGKDTVVVKDPVRMQYFRFGEAEAWLIAEMDGTRSLADLADGLRGRFGVASSEESLAAFVRRLKEMRLVERTLEERRLLLAESLRRERKLKLKGHGNTLFRMRFSLGDPDRMFDRLVEPLAFFWSPAFVVVSVLAFAFYVAVVTLHWGAIGAGIAAMYTPGFYTLGTIVMMYGATAVILGLHEVGHGLTCKRFGGEVHEIGAMLLYFMPAFFCNVNDAWMFEKRSHRLWVTFAGGWIQLLLASAAAAVWVTTEPGTFLHELAFFSLLVGGGLSLLLNYNPLLPLDGYYALMDWLEIPNLRQRSSGYLKATLARLVTRSDEALPACTPRERRVFLTYGILAWAYTALVLGFFGLFVARFLVGWLGAWGWAALAALVLMMFGGALRRSARALVRRSADLFANGGAARWMGGSAAGLALVLALAAVLPWTVEVRGRATIEPGDRAWLRSPETGRLVGFETGEGTALRSGQRIALVVDPATELELARARAERDALARRAATASVLGRTEEARQAEIGGRAAAEEVARLERRIAALALTAPFDGRVVTPHVDELNGLLAERGDSLVELWSDAPPRLRVFLAERDAGRVSPGDRLRVRFPAAAGVTVIVRVERVAAAAHDGLVEVHAALPADAPAALRVGMSGRARIDVERTTVSHAFARAMRRVVRADFLL